MSEAEKEREFSDEELILRYRDGEEEIIGLIMDKYKNLVRKKAGSMFILGGDRDDLIQEGMIGLFKAVRDYDTGRDVSFFTFADLCISRQMYTAVQASTRQKHFPLNTYISLYSHYVKNAEGVPHCECGGIIKPDVVLYEESLDSRLIQKSIRAISEADALIIGGTSLVVYPAAGFIDYFRGKHLVVINKGATAREVGAELTIAAPIGEVMRKIVI